MTASIIDRVNGFTIRKLHTKDGRKTFGFQIVPNDYDGRDVARVINDIQTLTAARLLCGAAIKGVKYIPGPTMEFIVGGQQYDRCISAE